MTPDQDELKVAEEERRKYDEADKLLRILKSLGGHWMRRRDAVYNALQNAKKEKVKGFYGVHLANRCPTCECSLFVGDGGWITCSGIGCKTVALDEMIQNAKREERERCAKIAEKIGIKESELSDCAYKNHDENEEIAKMDGAVVAGEIAKAIREMKDCD